MEAMNLYDGCWDRKTLDSFNLEFINLKSFGDYITKENNFEE